MSAEGKMPTLSFRRIKPDKEAHGELRLRKSLSDAITGVDTWSRLCADS